MTIQDAKNIKLADYLHSLGYNPVKQQGVNLWYKSPFREEKEPSFKVNAERNLWYDFAMGKGGNIIALAQELYASDSLSYLLQRVEEQSPSIRPVSFSFRQQSSTQPSFQQLEIVPLSSPALYSYLQEIGINAELAKRKCVEVRFTNNSKHYFAIGFPNVSGGYEVRNSFFKGCIAPKDITHIQQQGEPRDTCYMFEGFMDYLSFLTLRQKKCPNHPDLDKQDYIILNSVSNLSKALYPLGNYEKIHCFFDNDKAGIEVAQKISNEYSYRVRDASHIYSGYKDLNDYLCGMKHESNILINQHIDKSISQCGSKSVNQDNSVPCENKEEEQEQTIPKTGRGFRL